MFTEGQRLRFSVAWTNAGATPADPETVRFRYEQPDGTVTTFEYLDGPEIIRSGVGGYYVERVVDPGGLWLWRWEGSGNGIDTADEGAVAVLETRIGADSA